MGTSYDQTFGFSWSPASQLLTRTASNALYKWATPTPGTTANAYDGLNRDSAIVTAGGYDARGNLTADGSRTFTYNVENRMLTAVSGGTTVTFAYDPIGRLKTTATPTSTTFLYDSDRLVAEYNAAGTVLRRYVHGPGVDEPLVWFEGASGSWPQFLHQDRQGSVIAWSSVNGYVAADRIYKYGPWGEPGDNWGAGSRFRYTGQIAIPEARLYYYKARMYDPATGRFMQTDPIGYKDDLDLYAYVGGDPMNWSDPTGLMGECSATNHVGCTKGAAAESPGPVQRAGQVIVSTVRDTWNSVKNIAKGDFGPRDLVNVAAAATLPFGGEGVAAKAAGAEVPAMLARVIPAEFAGAKLLGREGAKDVFVTAASDIAGMNAAQIAERLTIPANPGGFRVIEFPTPNVGLACPVCRNNPGFVGGGRTAGGAREYVIPNGPIPDGARTRIVK